MALKNNNGNGTSPSPSSVSSLFLLLSLLCILTLSSYFLFDTTHKPNSSSLLYPSLLSHNNPQSSNNSIKVFVAELPRSLNYGLLDNYWSLDLNSRIGSEADNEIRSTLSSNNHNDNPKYPPPYPENPIIKQYSAEYWITGDLMTPQELRTDSFAIRVFDPIEADVVFVPFFATVSAELQLAVAKGAFRKKVGNDDYVRQRNVLDFIKGTQAWKRSGGRDHVFVLTDPVAMWHVKAEIAPAILLVVDFGGWYKLDSKGFNGSVPDMIQHTQVSLLKDVIVPYTHLLPTLNILQNRRRDTLLYFKGAKHRHRGGMVREKLWDLLVSEPGVIMEEGFPNATGKEQSIKGMRSSEFCLHPAGDTPTSCRLFDAIQSLCIPVVVSDNIELPFEGLVVDYSEFSVFVAVSDALRPNWLMDHLRSFSMGQKDRFRRNMARIQPIFEYENGYPGGIGPVPRNGAVNQIWRKVHQKIPMIKESMMREKRRHPGVSVPLRCHCT